MSRLLNLQLAAPLRNLVFELALGLTHINPCRFSLL